MCRIVVAADRRAFPAARLDAATTAAADAGGAGRNSRRPGVFETGLDPGRGCPLDRSVDQRIDGTGRRAGGGDADAGGDRRPSRLPSQLGRSAPCHLGGIEPPGRPTQPAYRRDLGRRQGAARGGGQRNPQADRRGAVVCRGIDQGAVGNRPAGGTRGQLRANGGTAGPGRAQYFAGLPDGATGPHGSGQERGPGRRGCGALVRLSAAGANRRSWR